MALKLQSFTTQVLLGAPSYWTKDIDRLPTNQVLVRLCAGTAVSFDRAWCTGLAAFEGNLWDRYNPVGHMDWLTPIGKCGRRRKLHGQQYCRRCLETDSRPYFRRYWRLAFNVACERHQIMLDDACRVCGSPVEFHVGDFGKRLLDFECQITHCATCGSDFRQRYPSSDRLISASLIDFQTSLNELLRAGYSQNFPGASVYSHMFFKGFRHLVGLLCSSGRFKRVRDRILLERGMLGFEVGDDNQKLCFECLRVSDRAFLLDMASTLIKNWPDEFVEVCKLSRVSSSYIIRYPNDLPYWLNSVISLNLDDRDYAPCIQERRSVEAYLINHGVDPNRNTVNRWLGVSSVDTTESGLRQKRARWNPRR